MHSALLYNKVQSIKKKDLQKQKQTNPTKQTLFVTGGRTTSNVRNTFLCIPKSLFQSCAFPACVRQRKPRASQHTCMTPLTRCKKQPKKSPNWTICFQVNSSHFKTKSQCSCQRRRCFLKTREALWWKHSAKTRWSGAVEYLLSKDFQSESGSITSFPAVTQNQSFLSLAGLAWKKQNRSYRSLNICTALQGLNRVGRCC